MAGSATAENPAAAVFRKRRRLTGARILSGMQTAWPARCRGYGAVGLAEELGKLFGDGAAEFLGIDDGNRTAIIPRHVVTDADRDQFDRRTGLDLLDDVAQMPLEVIARVDRQGGIVDRRAVGNHHQDLALLRTSEQALVRPIQRL